MVAVREVWRLWLWIRVPGVLCAFETSFGQKRVGLGSINPECEAVDLG